MDRTGTVPPTLLVLATELLLTLAAGTTKGSSFFLVAISLLEAKALIEPEVIEALILAAVGLRGAVDPPADIDRVPVTCPVPVALIRLTPTAAWAREVPPNPLVEEGMAPAVLVRCLIASDFAAVEVAVGAVTLAG